MKNYFKFMLIIVLAFTSFITAQVPKDVKTMLSYPHRAGSLFVRFYAGTSQVEKELIFQQLNATKYKELKIVPDLYIVTVSEKSNMEENLNWLKRNKEIMYTEPNYTVKLLDKKYRGTRLTPNDYVAVTKWGLAAINAPEAWDTETDSTIIVAVIDDGVDWDHKDLAANIWTNAGETDSNNTDDDNNGYIDDIHGYDFVNDDANPDEEGSDSHGTHVAGIVGAVGNNSTGTVGVCWSIKIMALKAGEDGTLEYSAIIEAIQYAINNGAKIINMSFGGYALSKAEQDAMEKTKDAKVICVVAAGNESNDNDTTPSYPASLNFDNIISVAASNQDNELADFSNYGKTSVDLMAPGVDIYSTLPVDKYGTKDGTSMAAPMVAGAAALLWAQFPNLKYNDIIWKLLKNTKKTNLRDDNTRSGLINLEAAINDTDSNNDGDDGELDHGSGGCSSYPHTKKIDLTNLLPFLILFLFVIYKKNK